mmetsp:Transcript_84056/g.148631  ORF Transcript_84056/g.148631 Transcript_84056/m.148631 type:complete len:444 (-) Transcript_84056:88-1419(-)
MSAAKKMMQGFAITAVALLMASCIGRRFADPPALQVTHSDQARSLRSLQSDSCTSQCGEGNLGLACSFCGESRGCCRKGLADDPVECSSVQLWPQNATEQHVCVDIPAHQQDVCCELVVQTVRDLIDFPSPDIHDAVRIYPWRSKTSLDSRLETFCSSQQIRSRMQQARSMHAAVDGFVQKVKWQIAGSYPAGGHANPIQVLSNFVRHLFTDQNSNVVVDFEHEVDLHVPKNGSANAANCKPDPASEVCTAVPAFAEIAGGVAEQIRMRHATVAAVLRSVVLHTLSEDIGITGRRLLFYRAYHNLTAMGAGVYYPDAVYGDLAYLVSHTWDILNRCTGDFCAYAQGIRHEKEVGAFRSWNALESLLLYNCFEADPECTPWFTPLLSEIPSDISEADFFAIHYAYGEAGFGEAIWLPYKAADNSTKYCSARSQFTPNIVSYRPY